MDIYLHDWGCRYCSCQICQGTASFTDQVIELVRDYSVENERHILLNKTFFFYNQTPIVWGTHEKCLYCMTLWDFPRICGVHIYYTKLGARPWGDSHIVHLLIDSYFGKKDPDIVNDSSCDNGSLDICGQHSSQIRPCICTVWSESYTVHWWIMSAYFTEERSV